VPDDVVPADWSRITKPLGRAIKLGTVAPKRKKQLWATEFSWDSNPPDPQGIPARLEATYMEGAFNTMWSQGVSAVIWYLMRDQPPLPSYAATLQSGIYMRGATIADDKPKPSFTAFRFPFTAYQHKGRAQLWGIAPSAGRLAVQAQSANGTWKTVARLTARSSDRMFLGSKKLRAGTTLRAVQGSNVSLTWRVFSPGK
jgi:O-glycosyl hydrolase